MSTNNSASIRHKLYDYIRLSDDRKLYAIYNLLKGEIEETKEWWRDKRFVEEIDKRYQALESGEDKGFTVDQVVKSIDKLRKKRNAS